MTLAPTDSALAIDLSHVAKTYRGKVRALRGIEMRVARGEIFGLLGPNGAGKSTLVKILMTVVRPNRCEGRLLDRPVGHKPTLRRVGYLPEHSRLPAYLTGRQVLDFYATLAGVPRRRRRRRAEELLETVGMRDWADKKTTSYSKGMIQRISLAQALMNDPELILLDEPTDGVDPLGRREIRDVLSRLRDEGKTVFLNSHILSELEMVCDRVAILVQGMVAQQGTVDALTADSRRYEVVIEGAPPAWARDDEGLTVQSTDKPAPDCSILSLRSVAPSTVQPIIDRLRAEQRTIISVRPVRESLEDLFMRSVTDPHTGRPLAPGAERQRRGRRDGSDRKGGGR